MGKTRKKAEQYEVLLSGEFWGAHDFWTEYLCMEHNKDGSITLTSRARQILAEAGRYRERGWLPETIRRKEVWGYEGDYVVGQRLLPHDGDAELTVSQNQFDVAARWLKGRKWDIQAEIGEAWAQIRSALYGPEFFTLSKPYARSAAWPPVLLGRKVWRQPSRASPMRERHRSPTATSRARLGSAARVRPSHGSSG